MQATDTTERVQSNGKVDNLTPPDEPLFTIDPDPRTTPATPTPPAGKAPRKGRDRSKDTRTSHAAKNTAAGPGRQPGPGRPANFDKRAKRVSGIHGLLAQPLQAVAPIAGAALENQAGEIGDAWAAWAEINPKVAKWLDKSLDGAGLLGVLAAYLPIAMAVYAEIAMRQAAAEAVGPRRTAPPSQTFTATAPADDSTIGTDPVAHRSTHLDDLIAVEPDAIFAPGTRPYV